MKITGDFRHALAVLIEDLVCGVKTHAEMLETWDTLRGEDWFMQTHSESYSEEEDDE